MHLVTHFKGFVLKFTSAALNDEITLMRHTQDPANFAVLCVLLVSALLVIGLDADASSPIGAEGPAMIAGLD